MLLPVVGVVTVIVFPLMLPLQLVVDVTVVIVTVAVAVPFYVVAVAVTIDVTVAFAAAVAAAFIAMLPLLLLLLLLLLLFLHVPPRRQTVPSTHRDRRRGLSRRQGRPREDRHRGHAADGTGASGLPRGRHRRLPIGARRVRMT